MQKIIQKYLGKRYAESKELGHQCVAWAKLFAREMGYPIAGFSGSALKGWQTGSPFSSEWQRVENTPQAVPKPGAIIFFDATKDNPYGHVAVVESASSKLLIVIEQNAGNGNGNGLGMNAITRRTVGYTATASRGKCLGWYEYVGKPAPTPTPTPAPEKPLTLKEIYERELQAYKDKTGKVKPQKFSDLSGDQPATIEDVKYLIEIANLRA